MIGDQIQQGMVEIIIDDYIVERLGMSDVLGGGGQTALDHLLAVLLPANEAGAQAPGTRVAG